MAKLDILTLGDGSTWHPDLPGPRHAHYCDWDGCGVLWVCFDPACHEGPARNCPRCVREAEMVQREAREHRAFAEAAYAPAPTGDTTPESPGGNPDEEGTPLETGGALEGLGVQEPEAVQALQDPEREPMFLGPVRESVPDLGETPPDETASPKRTRRKAGRATKE